MTKFEMLQYVADYITNNSGSLGVAVNFQKFLANEAWGKISQLVEQIAQLG